MLIGTIQYMAPEQVEGKPADARSDIFALGAIVYEMTTGRKAFEGTSSASVMAAIVTATPPPMATRQPVTPPALDRLVRRCLAKDPENRWQSARDLASELKWIAEGDQASAAPSIDQSPRKQERLAWSIAVVAAATAVIAVLAVSRSTNAPARTPMRFEIAPPDGSNGATVPIISPDGTKIAFVAATADGKSFLWVRSLTALESKSIVDADDHAFPFWSADSRSLAFFSDGKLKTIDANGGPVQVLCDAPAGRGGAWNRNGVILFAPAANTALYRISSGGGPSTQVTSLAANPIERSHRFPHFLPDGRHFTYDAVGQASAIVVGSLDSSESTRLVEHTQSEAWAPPGYVLFVRDDNLMVQSFDEARTRFTGEAVPIINRVAGGGVAQNYGYSVSENGVLTYVTRTAPATRLTWLSRAGRLLEGVGRTGDYARFAVAADGSRVVAEREQPQTTRSEIWVIDLSKGSEFRLVLPEARDPIWSPDGSRIAYEAFRSGNFQEHLYIKSGNGTGVEQMLPVSRDFGSLILDHWSPDGQFLLFELFDHSTAIHNLWLMPVAAGRQPQLFLRTNFNKVDAQFSPDGRWVAYGSDESGTSEVYVQSFPDSRSKWQVSTNGGKLPRWRRDGRELFYFEANDTLMAVPVDSGVAFNARAPKALFASPNAGKGVETRYDVAPDGERFLFNVVAQPAKPSSITVVLNWQSALAAREKR
jgi:Tol biopolymer transport system component